MTLSEEIYGTVRFCTSTAHLLIGRQWNECKEPELDMGRRKILVCWYAAFLEFVCQELFHCRISLTQCVGWVSTSRGIYF